ncbi:MAG: HAD family hydrolase [bacterium]|nr:HAD family hydrolase [bacterium]
MLDVLKNIFGRKPNAIVLDLDNTLADDFGSEARPQAMEFLQYLQKQDYRIILWTNSSKDRAREIISRLKFRDYFVETIYREDYDPENTGIYKDIRKINGDVLIDDDPEEIRKNRANGKVGYLIPSYRRGQLEDQELFKALDRLRL